MSNQPSQLAITASALLGFAIGNRTAVASAIKQAKETLGITKDTRALTDEDKARITELWQNQYNSTDDKQTDFVELVESIAAPVINEPIELAPAVGLHIDTTLIPVRLNNEPIELAPAPIEQVETIPPAVDDIAVNEAVALINAPLSEIELLKRENAKLQARIAVIDSKHAPTYPDNQLVRLTVNGKQIALKGAYLNALMVATGIDKASVKKWLESAVIDYKNVTESVKLLIVRELESELIKARK